MYKKKLWVLAAAVCASAFLFAGCQKKAEDEGDNSSDKKNGTVTITDINGEVEIPAKPERIVDISGCSDILHILGYNVIGTANSDAYDYTKLPSYLEDTLTDAEILGYFYQDTMDVEAILALEPDLIIMSKVQEKMYEQLSAAAPTVMIELAQIDWTEDLMNIAGVMNKEKEAEEWLTAYEEKAADTGAKIRKNMGEDVTYAAFLASGGSIFVFTETGMGSIMYNDFDMKRPEGMPEQSDVSLPVITYEGLAEIDADYMLAIGTEEDLEALRDNDIWNSLECVKNNNYVELPADVYFGIGFSSVGRDKFLDEAETLFDGLKK